jgi:HSP20 family molecular chaperone IbpA
MQKSTPAIGRGSHLRSCRAAPGQAVLVRRPATFMNRNWTPESRVSVTDAGMVTEIELGAVQAGGLEIFVEAGQLCVRGWHDDLGPFETRFGITPDHDLADAKANFKNGILRIDVPTKDKSSGSKPRPMMIYCNECGNHFDIVVTSKGSRDYRCPACGKVHAFDLEAFVNKALEQDKKMLKKKRGRR